MNNSWLRRLAQILTVFGGGILLVSAVTLLLAPDTSNSNWLGNLSSSFVVLGTPILGLIITIRQPHNRIFRYRSLVENRTREQSPLVIVFSTLTIAALFNPLRTHIQDSIDRRFYRKKYDAQKALARLAAAAHEEVDMDRLTSNLITVIEETLEPEEINLWLK